jgi:hypothetical protein
MIEPKIGLTKFGATVVELLDDNITILKAYASVDGSKIRIVLPELKSYKQSRIDIDSHYIDFDRR